MDVRLPDGSGIEACREIREARPETKVVILTSYADDDAVFAAILAGASGYVLKQTRGNAVADAIAAVARGESLLDPSVTQKVMERMRSATARKESDPLDKLNEQEHKILQLIAEGKTNKEIAADVFLSDKTVKNYVSSILTKLNLRRRSEAAAFIARRDQPKSAE
jgi:DNA-binding NarL/FixJ family response regulator